MRRLVKKITTAVLAMTLVLAVGTTCMAATWSSYFGADEGWYEGASGSLSKNTATAFTADLTAVGWGGIWGAQVFTTEGISIKKGTQYTLSFTASSSNVTKYIYVKISTDETLAYSTWVKIPAGDSVEVSETFTAAADATSVYFGLGGDAGDRVGVSTDTDAEVRYAVLGDNYQALLQEDANGDYTAATSISITKFSLTEAKPGKATIKKVTAQKKKAKVKLKKVTGAEGYQIQYSLKKSMKGAKKANTTKLTYTIKKLKSGKKYYVRARAYSKGKKAYGAWSKKKTVKVK